MVDESGMADKDRIISALKRRLHQKDILISQQQREIARFKEVEHSLFWKIARRGSALTYRRILPPGTRRGEFVYQLLQWSRGGLPSVPGNDEEWKKYFVAGTHGVDVIEPLNIGEMDSLRFSLTESPKVSIIIPTWNKCLFLYYCLKAILENSAGAAYEIIVVDNGSTDDTPELLKQTQTSRSLGAYRILVL